MKQILFFIAGYLALSSAYAYIPFRNCKASEMHQQISCTGSNVSVEMKLKAIPNNGNSGTNIEADVNINGSSVNLKGNCQYNFLPDYGNEYYFKFPQTEKTIRVLLKKDYPISIDEYTLIGDYSDPSSDVSLKCVAR